MKVDLKDGTITLTLAEIGDVVGVRKKAAHMETIMADGKTENYMCSCYNQGVDIMAKYILDFFGNEFDKAQFAEWNK